MQITLLSACFIHDLLSSIFQSIPFTPIIPGPGSAVGSECDFRSRGRELDPRSVPYFREIDHEIISTAIFLLPLIQEGLSVTSETMCTKYWITS